jgi:hypothetical protein
MKKEELKYTWEDMLDNNAYVPNYFMKATAWHTLRSFQCSGYDMWIDVVFDEDPRNSGVIDDFRIKILKFKEDHDRFTGRLPREWLDEQTFDFGEVDPEEIFWLGTFLIRLAEHYGVNKESLLKKHNRKEES